jgi:3-phenylpropionate/trans-cinnamate dioxygenase ferredoxin subunit
MFNYAMLDTSKVEFLDIAPADQLPNGERMFIEVEGRSIVILNLGGNLYAIGDICTHDNGPVGDGEIEEKEIICPRHGARFDLETGKATSLPAVVDIPAYPVRVENGMIQVGFPRDKSG